MFLLREFNKKMLVVPNSIFIWESWRDGIQFTYDDLIKKMGYANLNRNLKEAGGFLNNI